MKTLPELDVYLDVEHEGHGLKLTGSGTQFEAAFPSIQSAIHFLRVLWPIRKKLPPKISVSVRWRSFRIPVKYN